MERDSFSDDKNCQRVFRKRVVIAASPAAARAASPAPAAKSAAKAPRAASKSPVRARATRSTSTKSAGSKARK